MQYSKNSAGWLVRAAHRFWIGSLVALALVINFDITGAGATTLYDDSLGNTPGNQSWLFSFGLGTVSESAASNGVDLVTDEGAQAGYSNYVPFFNTLKNSAFPSLDRSAGFQLSFELQLNSENHAVDGNRAGFSVIFLGSDKQGIELGFWTDTIFAQSGPSFTHAEEAYFNTATTEAQYDLLILGNGYKLSANGDTTPILTGNVRDYSTFGVPYSLSNYLFLGDDSTSAGASITLGNVSLTSPIPEPAEWVLLSVGIGVVTIFSTRRKLRRPDAGGTAG